MFRYRDYIYSVYEEKSFTKAAEKLHISQPTLSALVRKEENIFGQPIFNRKNTPLSLTLFGTEYIRSIELIFELEQQLQKISDDLNDLLVGSLSIGASNLSIPYFLTEAMSVFKRKYPNIKLSIVETNTIQAKHLLDTGDLDFIITNSPLDRKEYDVRTCYHEHLVVAVPRDYNINRKLAKYQLKDGNIKNFAGHMVSLSEFHDVPFILLGSRNYLRTCTDMMFKEVGIEPKIVMEVEQSSISFNFANYGIGATIFSNKFINNKSQLCNLNFYAINSGFAKREGFICCRNSCHWTAAMQRFFEILTATNDDNKLTSDA